MPSDQHGIFHHICIWRGFVLAAPMMAWGLWCVTTQWSLLPYGAYRLGIHGFKELTGWPAVVLGVGWLGAGFALHAHYIWGCIELAPLRLAGQLGTLVGVFAFIIGFGGTLIWFAWDFVFGFAA